MQDLPKEERPRERFLEHGAETLSSTELLALILRTGSQEHSALTLAKMILQETNGLERLNDVSANELMTLPGIGVSKSVQLLASVELGRRVALATPHHGNEKPALTNPDAVFELMGMKMKHLKQEHFVVLFLDVKQRLICKETLFVGSLDMALVHPREIFRKAVKHLASAVVCLHNHPSGDLTLSPQDLALTKQLAEAGEMMNIPLLDHIVIGGDDYVSLKALGHV